MNSPHADRIATFQPQYRHLGKIIENAINGYSGMAEENRDQWRMRKGAFDAMKKAFAELTADHGWENCDDETGEECKGIDCHVGAHKAATILAKALEVKP